MTIETVTDFPLFSSVLSFFSSLTALTLRARARSTLSHRLTSVRHRPLLSLFFITSHVSWFFSTLLCPFTTAPPLQQPPTRPCPSSVGAARWPVPLHGRLPGPARSRHPSPPSLPTSTAARPCPAPRASDAGPQRPSPSTISTVGEMSPPRRGESPRRHLRSRAEFPARGRRLAFGKTAEVGR